jgi:pimeloyl-ACP methyl ester carboxylesterase
LSAAVNYAPIPPDKLASIACPVLILQGEKGIYTSPLEAAQAWQKSLPNAKGGAAIHVVAGAPHLMAYFEPGVTARIVQQFVTRCERGLGGGVAMGELR